MIIIRNKTFTQQEKAPQWMLDEEGVIHQDTDGSWRIVNRKKGTLWNARYKSKESAQAGLRGYFANK